MVCTLRALYDAGAATQAALGARFGLDQTTVGDIVRRRSWRHLD
jgi:DNA-binding MarR family transcriptional regulator